MKIDSDTFLFLLIGLPLGAAFAWFLIGMAKSDINDFRFDTQMGRPITIGRNDVREVDRGNERYHPLYCLYCFSINAVFFNMNDFHTQKKFLNCHECKGKMAVTLYLQNGGIEKVAVEKTAHA